MNNSLFVIRASVPAEEQAALSLAALRVADCLAAAGADACRLDCAFADIDAPPDVPGGRELFIASLLPEVERFAEPWNETETRLRARMGEAARSHEFLYLLTVFRSVHEGDDPALAAARRIRIRRLNLLAADVSRETGALVIDVDRALADVGARVLATDYRLSGVFAAEAVARCVAGALLTTAFDDHVAAGAIEAARAHLASLPPPWPNEASARAPAAGLNTLSMRVGGFAQTVQTFGESENQAALYLRALASGKISPWDALGRFRTAVERRGLRNCAALAWNGAAHLAARSMGRGRRGRA
ncbi:hypothetical protein [Methylocella silvestris]|uniref:Uncharacterized protein n=1 Tax=Methylocella silvestris TaxID=199596 RepID=A0A2J7TD81_METSI|nr:hypothetical protein [Methylocella silvestris]PNG24720.1 hypothetical protein CR492_17090 [Methylocella silvestris]